MTTNEQWPGSTPSPMVEHIRTEQVRAMLKFLENLGYEVKPLWQELERRVEVYETGEPGELDMKYTLPESAPLTGKHFAQGDPLPQALSAHVMWPGHHYSLTPGQREWLRDNTALTPSATVTVAWAAVWPGTRHPRSFKIVSDVHIDPRHRKHVLNEYVVREPGRFFTESAQNDAREKVEKTMSLALGKVNVWSAKHRWVVEDLCGVKLKGDEVEIVLLTELEIGFQDLGGRRANVNRDEFLSTLADYEKLYAEKGAKRGGKDKCDPSATLKIDFGKYTKGLEESLNE